MFAVSESCWKCWTGIKSLLKVFHFYHNLVLPYWGYWTSVSSLLKELLYYRRIDWLEWYQRADYNLIKVQCWYQRLVEVIGVGLLSDYQRSGTGIRWMLKVSDWYERAGEAEGAGLVSESWWRCLTSIRGVTKVNTELVWERWWRCLTGIRGLVKVLHLYQIAGKCPLLISKGWWRCWTVIRRLVKVWTDIWRLINVLCWYQRAGNGMGLLLNWW